MCNLTFYVAAQRLNRSTKYLALCVGDINSVNYRRNSKHDVILRVEINPAFLTTSKFMGIKYKSITVVDDDLRCPNCNERCFRPDFYDDGPMFYETESTYCDACGKEVWVDIVDGEAVVGCDF